jgi:hypothetical protein
MLVGALLVRLTAALGYRPALWFNDSFEYVGVALRPQPYVVRPAGYSLFLAALRPFHSFELVVVLQHLLGLGVGAMVYALLRRHGGSNGVAAFGAAPPLFDGNQIELEHLVLSETLFTFLTVAGVTVLLWRRSMPIRSALAAGALLSAAALTRTVGLATAVVAVVFLAVRRPGWRPFLGFLTALLLPLAGYAGWYQSVHGRIGITGSDGVFLYSRTATFADCARIHPPADLAILCPTGASAVARARPSDFIWHDSPLDRLPGPKFGADKDSLARRFAWRAIVAQPLDYVAVSGRDFSRAFGPRIGDYPSAGLGDLYRFGGQPLPIPDEVTIPGGTVRADLHRYGHADPRTRQHQPMADWVAAYQRYVVVPGPMLGLGLLAGVLGIGAAVRRRRLRAPLVLITATGLALLAVPPLTAGFDYRYVPPALPFLGAGAGLALALVRRPAGVGRRVGEALPSRENGDTPQPDAPARLAPSCGQRDAHGARQSAAAAAASAAEGGQNNAGG